MTTVSTFPTATDTVPRNMNASTVLKIIRTGGKKLKGQIEQIRKRFKALLALGKGDYKKAKHGIEALKKQLPGVTWSAQLRTRDKAVPLSEKLVAHTGLLCADVDSLGSKLAEVREKLLKSPHLWALFLSPSGDGLKAVFRVLADASIHLTSFRAVEHHVLELTGVQIDQSRKDVAGLCFLSYDPDVYHNPNATEIAPLPEPVKLKLKRHSGGGNTKPDKEQIREMLAVIPKRPDYSDWIKVVAAVGDALPDDEAIEVLNEWSSEEQPGEYAEKLRHRLEDVHVGTLIHVAREHGWTGKIALAAKASDEETIARLAALPVLEYERCREAEAKKLGCRESVLDKLVEAKRPRNRENNGLQGNVVKLKDVEPWPESVNGAEVLDAIAKTFASYVVLPSEAADMCSLWCALAHVFEVFRCSPRLNARSAAPECGKTTLRDTVGLFVPRPVLTENFTVAVLFRLVNAQKPTILADEYDTWLIDNEEMRGLLNAGHRRGAMVYRCEGDGNEVRGFNAYAPAMLCGIDALPGTLHDRSIVIRLERAKPDELGAIFDSERTERETELCRKLARWCADNRERFAAADPELPPRVFNRLADNWRPLFAIANIAGGDWPRRAGEAFTKLTSTKDLDAQGVGTLLLTDIAAIFTAKNTDKIFSAQLCEDLAAIEGRPWAEWRRQRKPISVNQLATQLRRFSVSPHEIRIGEKTGRGYELGDFEDTFSRYLADTPAPDRNSETLRGKTAVSKVKHAETVFHPENGHLQRECFTVSLQKGDTSENADSGEPDVQAASAGLDTFLPAEQSTGKEKLRI